jgi:hypothetical protein
MAQVIKLPTAAPRKVKQRYNAKLRAYREANPWPGKYLTRYDREEAEKSAELAGLERNAELFCLLAIFNALPVDVMQKVRETADLLIRHAPDEDGARAGFALIRQATAMRGDAAGPAKLEDR